MKFFLYEMPKSSLNSIKSIDLKEIQDLMGGLVAVSLGNNIDNFVRCDSLTVLPGEEEHTEAFRNMEFISNLVKAEEFKPLIMPTNEAINKAKILKLVFDHLQDEHRKGHATTLQGVHTTVEKLLNAMQIEVVKSGDVNLADAIFNLNLANTDLVKSNFPSLISNTMPWERRISPVVLELEAGKFFRDQYPAGYVISDIEEISKLAKKFLQMNPIGVPEDIIGDIFLEVCSIK